jgi:hypothetical protein
MREITGAQDRHPSLLALRYRTVSMNDIVERGADSSSVSKILMDVKIIFYWGYIE